MEVHWLKASSFLYPGSPPIHSATTIYFKYIKGFSNVFCYYFCDFVSSSFSYFTRASSDDIWP